MATYFSIFLVILTLGSGLIWLIDSLFFAKRRRQQRSLASGSSAQGGVDSATELPVLVDNAKQFFPIFAVILVVRSFIYEPFQIPSGSMMPTLLVGDFILVEKFPYGFKDPVARTQLVDMGSPERGDIVVFKHPEDNHTDMIKRVVGLPGDRVIYKDKQLFIAERCQRITGCKPQPVSLESLGNSEFEQNGATLEHFRETLASNSAHEILRHPYLEANPVMFFTQPGTSRNEWQVPPGHYFVLGDNRDNSRDSRFWGFVPEANLVGKATFIWVSFEFNQDISWLPSWIPVSVRFERVGGLS